jgi:hypothetical protein
MAIVEVLPASAVIVLPFIVHYGGPSLVAFSEGADAFRGSLGWERHENTVEPDSRAR